MAISLHIKEITDLLIKLAQIILKQRKVKQFPIMDMINYDLVAKNIEEVEQPKNNSTRYYKLNNHYEFKILSSLFKIDDNELIYHYTTTEAIFNILKTGKLQLSPLAGLNDKSEINLINNFMGANKPYAEYYNSFFVFCCSKRQDDLNQWRLYGDDGKGVMLTFKIDSQNNNNDHTNISNIFYDINFFRVFKKKREEFKKQYNFSFGLYEIDRWKYFFKDSKFKDEEEVRIINLKYKQPNDDDFLKFKLNSYKMIVPYQEFALDRKIFLNEDLNFLPVKLTAITLGPKSLDKQENKIQIDFFINRLTQKNELNFSKNIQPGINYEHEYPKIKVDVSKIKNYR